MASAESTVELHPDQTGMRVEVVFSPGPRTVVVKALTLPAGATVRQAVDASEVLSDARPDAAHLRIGIWGRATTWSHVLRDQDRVELYRPLKADPKESRRLRYKKQGPAKRPGR